MAASGCLGVLAQWYSMAAQGWFPVTTNFLLYSILPFIKYFAFYGLPLSLAYSPPQGLLNHKYWKGFHSLNINRQITCQTYSLPAMVMSSLVQGKAPHCIHSLLLLLSYGISLVRKATSCDRKLGESLWKRLKSSFLNIKGWTLFIYPDISVTCYTDMSSFITRLPIFD